MNKSHVPTACYIIILLLTNKKMHLSIIIDYYKNNELHTCIHAHALNVSFNAMRVTTLP